jgi:hypothetical protein
MSRRLERSAPRSSPVRATLRCAHLLPDDALNKLVEVANGESLRGWILATQELVEAQLEGPTEGIARFATHWLDASPAEQRKALRAGFGPAQGDLDRARLVRDPRLVPERAGAMANPVASAVDGQSRPPTSALEAVRRRLESFDLTSIPRALHRLLAAGDRGERGTVRDPESAVDLRELVRRHRAVIASRLNVDRDQLDALIEETRGLTRARSNERITDYLGGHASRLVRSDESSEDSGGSARAVGVGSRNVPTSVRDGDVPELVAIGDRPGVSINPCFGLSLYSAGPVYLWPENSFPLLGTFMRPEQIDAQGISSDTYYLRERLHIEALLDELAVGKPLHRRWRELYATAGRQPDLGEGVVEGHPDVWGVAGVVDANLTWLEPADMTLQSRYASVPSPFTLPRTGSRAMRELGNAWAELPLRRAGQDDLHHRLANLRSTLHDRRDVVQSRRDDGHQDVGWRNLADLPVPIGVGYNYEDPPVPQLSDLHHVLINADRWPGAGGTWSDFPQAGPAVVLDELARAIPIVEESYWQVGYHYLRQRTLEVLKVLNEAHEALGFEQFERALNRYLVAERMLTEIIDQDLTPVNDPRRLTIVFTNPDTGEDSEVFLQRMMSIQSVLAPQDDPSQQAFIATLLFAYLAWALARGEEKEELEARLRAVHEPGVKPILDGRFVTRPLEDTLHYLREFVIPACRGEVFLRRGEWDRRDYDRALAAFEQAARYIPEDRRDSVANHFLWLRMARAHLLKGHAEYSASNGSWATAFDDFGRVLEDAYGLNGEVRVSANLTHNGMLKVNPLVLALRIEACIHRTNIEARVNALGYPENYVPAVRFNWISQQALGAVQALDEAEQRYIAFRVNAEDALQRFQQLAAATDMAALEVFAAGANVRREEAGLAAAQASLQATRNRLQNARHALDEFTELSTVRFVYGTFGHIAATIASSGATTLDSGLINLVTNDVFQKGQLRRQVEELEDAIRLAEQNINVASRTAAAARALERLARLKEVVAQDALYFEAEREFNYARWYALADEMRDIVRYRLRSTLRLVYLAQQAFYFMTGLQAGIVIYDVSPRDTARNIADRLPLQSYLMGQHIRDALDALQGEWISFYSVPGSSYQGRENCQPGASALVEDVRLDILYPLQFHTLRQNGGGRIEFDIALDDLDCRAEGTYLQLVEDVEVYGTLGNLGGQSVSATLSNSPYSMVRVRDTANRLTVGVMADWVPSQSLGFKTLAKSQPLATQEFRGTLQQSPGFSACTGPGSTPILSPFEYNGLAQRWTLEIKGSENPRLDFAQIVSLGVRFRFAQFRHGTSSSGLEALHAAHCANRVRGSVLLLVLYENFFVPGDPPLTPADRRATRQFLVDDFPLEHRINPTLLNLGCLFAPRVGAPPVDPVRFYLASDQYLDPTGAPIEVAIDTSPVPEGQIAVSEGSNPASQSPLNVFVDRDTTDAVVTPWLQLLTGPAGAPVGTTFRLRVNLNENPTFDLANLEYVILHFEYRYG